MLNERLGSASLIASGALAAQLVTLASLPLIARLYTPEAFGHVAPLFAAIAIVAAVATLRFEQAIPQVRRAASAALLARICLIMAGAVAVLTAAAVGLLEHGGWLGERTAAANVYWAVPGGVFVVSAAQTLYHMAVRHRRFAVLAAAKLTRSGALVASQIGFGILGLGVLGLAWAPVAAGLAVLVLYRARLRGAPQPARRPALRSAWPLLRALRRFPVYATPSALVQAMNASMPAALVAALYSPLLGGCYLLAQRLIEAPLGLATQSLAAVYHGDIVAARRAQAVPQVVGAALVQVQRLLVLPAFAAALAAPSVVHFALGPAWADAAFVIEALLPWLVLRIAFAPAQPLIPVMQWQRLSLAYQTLALLTGMAAIALGAALGSWQAGVVLYASTQVLVLLSPQRDLPRALWPAAFRAARHAQVWRKRAARARRLAALAAIAGPAVARAEGAPARRAGAAVRGVFCA